MFFEGLEKSRFCNRIYRESAIERYLGGKMYLLPVKPRGEAGEVGYLGYFKDRPVGRCAAVLRSYGYDQHTAVRLYFKESAGHLSCDQSEKARGNRGGDGNVSLSRSLCDYFDRAGKLLLAEIKKSIKEVGKTDNVGGLIGEVTEVLFYIASFQCFTYLPWDR